MSEFIAVCPKCRQQILCDTAYIGKRIACPVCMQEISMPEPPQANPPAGLSPVGSTPAAAGKRNPAMLVATIGGATVTVAVIAMLLVMHKSSSPVPQPSPSAPPSVATPASEPPPGRAASKPVPASSGTLDQCRANWTFSQDSGTTVIDSTGNGYNASVVGNNAEWVKATTPDSAGLRLDGSNYAEVSGAVVNTAQSFTVAARVLLDKMEAKKYQTFVSIDGNEISGFYLQFNPYAGGGTGRFEFDRMEDDSKNAAKVAAKAKPAVSTNTWYHLTGVYDAEAQRISMYLDGKFQDTVPYTHGWQAVGNTAIGRGRIAGHPGNYFTGAVRDVRFYAFALTADQIKKISK